MKRMIATLVLVVMFLAAASAGAETYTVRKGDNLSKIGKMYNLTSRAIAKANADKVKKPDLIYPGQVLQIPEKSSDAATAKSPFFWKNPGNDKFGRRDFVKAINLFKLPKEVKTLLIAEVKGGRFEWYRIASGDRFEQMVFGNYRVVGDVYAQWNPNRLLAAKKYSAIYDGKIYYLADPLICHNWAWWSETEEIKPAPPPAESPLVEEVIIPPPPPVVVEQEQPKPLILMMIPVEETPVEVAIPAKEPEPTEKCRPEWESYGWAGHYWSVEGSGQSTYYGGKANLFYCPHDTKWGRMREGAGFTVNGWDGDNSGYNFRGNRWTIGPVVDLTTKQGSRFTTTLQLGQQTDFGYDELGYDARQRTKILYFGQTADIYNLGFITKAENWLDVNFDIGHDKESSWQGWPISEANDPAEDKTSFSVGSRVYFWQTENWKGGVVGKGSYAFGDHAIGLEAGPFVADKEDIVKFGAGFRHQFNSAYKNNNGNLIGIGMDLDIVKTIDKIVRYLRTTNKEEIK